MTYAICVPISKSYQYSPVTCRNIPRTTFISPNLKRIVMYPFCMCQIPFVKSWICRQTSSSIDIRDHHMEKEGGGSQVTDGWQEDKLAQTLPGSRSAWFSEYTPGVQWRGKPFNNTKRKRVIIHRNTRGNWTCTQAHLSFCPGRCQVTLLWATFTSTWPAVTTTVCQPRQPVSSTTTQSGVFWALDISLTTLPTVPSCLPRLHQNCPSATTKLWASVGACQPHQPVTAALNHKII